MRPTPAEERVFFKVPELVPEELWEKASVALTVGGRGRGKMGVAIQALLHNFIFCPGYGLPLAVRREGDSKKIYYYCARHYRIWGGKTYGFRTFIPADWDDYIWNCVCALLSDNSWLERQLAAEQYHQEATTKLIDVEQRKIA